MWKVGVAGCGPLDEPNYCRDPDAFYEWHEFCTDPNPPAAPPLPPPCNPYEVWVNANCYYLVCRPNGHRLNLQCVDLEATRADPPDAPHIDAVVLKEDGADVLIRHGRRETVVNVPHGMIKLANLGRALIGRTPLPTADLKDVPADFWEALPKSKSDNKGCV
jgi:hypothetical protein